MKQQELFAFTQAPFGWAQPARDLPHSCTRTQFEIAGLTGWCEIWAKLQGHGQSKGVPAGTFETKVFDTLRMGYPLIL